MVLPALLADDKYLSLTKTFLLLSKAAFQNGPILLSKKQEVDKS